MCVFLSSLCVYTQTHANFDYMVHCFIIYILLSIHLYAFILSHWINLSQIYLFLLSSKIVFSWCSHCGKQYLKLLKKLKLQLPYDSPVPLVGIYLKNKNINWKRYMHLSVHRSIIYNSWTHGKNLSIHQWMNK